MDEISRNFKKITQTLMKNNHNMEIDFLGVNIYVDKSMEYKIYANNTSIVEDNDLLAELKMLNVVNNISRVVNSKTTNRFRVDVSLKNRNNQNMLNLLKVIEKKVSFVSSNLNEITAMSMMPVSKDVDLKYSSMYFFGFESFEKYKSAKFHYITRNIDDNTYDDMKYIEYLKSLNVEELSFCCKYMESIVDCSDGNLWMAAVDYFDDTNAKYKLFYQTTSEIVLENLLNKFDENENISKDLIKIKSYLELCKEIRFAGLAICYDRNNNFSINLYFKTQN